MVFFVFFHDKDRTRSYIRLRFTIAAATVHADFPFCFENSMQLRVLYTVFARRFPERDKKKIFKK